VSATDAAVNDNVDFPRKRYDELGKHPLFSKMRYSENPLELAEWMPLVMEGRDKGESVAATRAMLGTNVNFGSLTRALIDWLGKQDGVAVSLFHRVSGLNRGSDSRWHVHVQNKADGAKRTVNAKFVFLGAGGGALPLLQKSGIPEAKGFGGFPVSGQWLRCDKADLVDRHHAKVYGKAAVGSPPMSVPHLDARVIEGKRSLLFGPYAGFSTKFLKHGSAFDLPDSVKPDNLVPLLAAGRDNIDLTKYLIGQVPQSSKDRLAVLKEFVPTAKRHDWRLEVAGQRVQIIKKDPVRGGILQFGTEVVSSEDGSIAALLGASPGASTSVSIMLHVMQRCFKDEIGKTAWQTKPQGIDSIFWPIPGERRESFRTDHFADKSNSRFERRVSFHPCLTTQSRQVFRQSSGVRSEEDACAFPVLRRRFISLAAH
jgi:malate dehydrogenase (quinone)